MFPNLIKKLAPNKKEINMGRLSLQRSQIAAERLSRFRFFCEQNYHSMHSDIGTMSPALHYVGYGADEHRKPAHTTHIARTLGELTLNPIQKTETKLTTGSNSNLEVGIFSSSQGSIVSHEIADSLANLLTSAGHKVILGNEHSDIDTRPPHCLYVSPHEFFLLGRGQEWVRDDVMSTACMYCTAKVQSKGFWHSLHLVLMAKSLVDISWHLATAFSEVMPSTSILPSVSKETKPIAPHLPDHPLLLGQRWWTTQVMENKTTNRPLDLCFLGADSPRRSEFFVRNVEKLSHYESMIYLRKRNAGKPMNSKISEDALVEVAQLAARNARVMLNIHSDEFPSFQWHRLVYQGMANGCTVISEPCFENPIFKAGTHYLAEESRHLMKLAEWALNDKDGQEKARSVAEAAWSAAIDPDNQIARANALVDILTA